VTASDAGQRAFARAWLAFLGRDWPAPGPRLANHGATHVLRARRARGGAPHAQRLGVAYRAPLRPGGAVPPHAIVGARRVGADGRIVGEFVPNPKYRASARSGTPPA
jgi:hypothetical protein